MNTKNIRQLTHVGFSDESHWRTGRFRSVSLVTLPLQEFDSITERLRIILDEFNVSEFKWEGLRDSRRRSAAVKMLDLAVSMAYKAKLRVDVLIWDTYDERHDVIQRDDTQNLVRMYYHLFRNVLRKRWSRNSVWRLYPDEHTAIDWNNLEEILGHVARAIEPVPPMLGTRNPRFDIRYEFNLEDICQVESQEYSLLQLADLFAGLAVFSRDKYCEFKIWCANNPLQATMLPLAETPVTSSRPSVERFSVLRTFDTLCKSKRLGVSLRRNRGLHTFDPANPINFWPYIPQHGHDRAPQKVPDDVDREWEV